MFDKGEELLFGLDLLRGEELFYDMAEELEIISHDDLL